MTARALAGRIFAGVLLVVALVAGAILLSLDRADKAATTSRVNRERIAKNRARIATNEHKDEATRRCQTRARDVQRCIERVGGARGPGGMAGTAGARGLNGLRGRRGPRGLPGQNGKDAPAPTVEQIAAGFAVWCSQQLCVGKDGRDAPPVTSDELKAALLELCGGSCRGEDGQDVTQEMVDAAVATVCASGGCPAPGGPQGPQGPAGPQGDPAPQVPCAAQPPELGYQCVP